MAEHFERQTLCRSMPLVVIAGLLLNVGMIGISFGAPFTVSDPIGDNFGAPHDAIEIQGSFDAGNVYLVAKFDTFDPDQLGFIFGLDTDENPATGVQGTFPLGAEFSVYFLTGENAGQARVYTYLGASVGTVPVDFSANMLSVTVPRSLLNDDGPLNFGFVSGVPSGPPLGGFTPFDRVPNSVVTGPLVGPIRFVPEPASWLIVLCCLSLVVVRWHGRRHSRG